MEVAPSTTSVIETRQEARAGTVIVTCAERSTAAANAGATEDTLQSANTHTVRPSEPLLALITPPLSLDGVRAPRTPTVSGL